MYKIYFEEKAEKNRALLTTSKELDKSLHFALALHESCNNPHFVKVFLCIPDEEEKEILSLFTE